MSLVMEKNDQHLSEPYMAFVQDDITNRSLIDVVGLQGWNTNRIFEGGIDQAIEMLCELPTPQLLIIDVTSCMDPIEKISELASVCDAGVRLVCLGTMNDVTLYRNLLDMGIEDYLLKPIDPETLEHAVNRASTEKDYSPKQEEIAEGDVISIVGAIGGAGATSAAMNMAWDAAQNKSKRVALVDLDLHFGTIALSLDLEPGKGFHEALENPSRIDSLFLERAMVKVNDNFQILACETEINTMCQFGNEALDLLVERLRQKFDLVILDVPRMLLPQIGDLLARLGKFILVSDLSLAGMRDSLRMVRFAKDYMTADDLLLVANRCGENKERELSEKEFEKGVEKELNAIVPYDPKAFSAAELQATPLMKVACKSKSAKAMHGLFAKVIQTDDAESENKSFWKKMFNR